MTDAFILHHYDRSPYAEKVRLMFGVTHSEWVACRRRGHPGRTLTRWRRISPHSCCAVRCGYFLRFGGDCRGSRAAHGLSGAVALWIE